MHDFSFWGGGWMMIFWVFILILLIVVLVKAVSTNRTQTNTESPMDILKRRYANGEIDKEEFEERKNELLR